MNKRSYSSLALNAMHRASKKAIEKASSLNLTVPMWQDDKIIFVKAKEQLKKINYSTFITLSSCSETTQLQIDAGNSY
ncbi:MAG: hypothetical protein RBR67_13950 [Desulfobacterium sp.]|jgi:hypothetical protein|nr:hypothetical protein [Desulfobacterium sp.]